MFIKYKDSNGDFKDLKYGSSDERKVTKDKATDAWAEIPCVELPNWSCVSPSILYLSQASQYHFAVTANGSGERLPGKSSWVYSAAEFEGKNGLADKGKRVLSQGWKETGAGGGTFATIAPLSAKNCVGLEPDNEAEFTPSSTVVAVNGRRYHVGIGVKMFPVCTANPIHLEDAWEAAFTAQVWRKKLSNLDGLRKTDPYKVYERAYDDYERLAQGKAALRQLFTFTVNYGEYLKAGKLGVFNLLLKDYVEGTVEMATGNLYDETAVREEIGELQEAWENILRQTVEVGAVLKAIEKGERDWEAGADCGNHCKLDFSTASAIVTTRVLVKAADGLLKPVVDAAHKVRAIKEAFEIGEDIGGVLAGFLIDRGRMTKSVARNLGLNVGADTYINEFNTAFDRFRKEMPKKEQGEFGAFMIFLGLGDEGRYMREHESKVTATGVREAVMPKLVKLVISPSGGGRIDVDGKVVSERKEMQVKFGSTLRLTAIPEPGHHFSGWAGSHGLSDIDKMEPEVWLDMSRIRWVYAQFKRGNAAGTGSEVKRRLYIQKTPTEGGRVTLSPYVEERNEYVHGTTVTVTARPGAGYRFVQWEGDRDSTRSSLSVRMDGDVRLRAVFESLQPILTVSAQPADGKAGWIEVLNGTGSTSGQRLFERGETARIRVHTNDGWRFVRWELGASGSTTWAQVLMDRDKRVRAVFERVSYTLQVEATPSDGKGGYVEVHNGSGSEPGQRVFDVGEYANLEARPNSGWRFVRWELGASGSTTWAQVLMDRDKRVRAVFERVSYTLQVEATPNDGKGGYVEVHNGSGSEPGQRVFDVGEYANLEARPNSGWRFVRWELGASGSTTWEYVLMDRDKRVRAVFEQVQPSTYTLTVSANPSNGSGGYVEVNNGSGTTPGQWVFDAGDSANLAARPSSGWRFVRWELDASGSNTRASVLMNRDKRVRAVFERVPLSTFTLVVESSPSSAGQVLIHNGGGNVPGERTFHTGDVAEVEAVAWSGWCFWVWTVSWSSWTGTSPTVNVTIGGPGRETMTAHFYGC